MHKTKVVRLLASLSPVEINRLGKFVHSPFFNVHEPTLLLWQLLRAQYPNFSEQKLNKEILFKEIYPGEKFSDGKLGVLRNNLLRLIQAFLVQQSFESDELLRQRFLLRSLSEHKQDHFLPKLIQEGRDKIRKHPEHDVMLSYHAFMLEDFVSEYGLLHSNRSIDVDFQQVMNHLDHFYLVLKLRYACAMIGQGHLLAKAYDISLLQPILLHCKELDFQTYPLIGTYYLCFRMLREEDTSCYDDLKALTNRHLDDFSREDQTNLLGFMVNFCNEQYKKGKLKYMREMFVHYQKMLELDLLFEASMLSSVHYLNIVSISLHLKEYGWAEGFIYKYQDRIDEEYRRGAFHYNLARLNFARKQFDEVLRHLHEFELIDPIYKLSYNLLLLKTYYECEEGDAFFSLCSAFRTYLRRSKTLSKDYISGYLNFITMARKLFKEKVSPQEKLDTEAFGQALKTENQLMERAWLIEKLKEFREKVS
jgi:hypothetical protein